MGFADRDCRFHRTAKSHSASRGRAVVRRPSGRSGLAGDRRGRAVAARHPAMRTRKDSWARPSAAGSATRCRSWSRCSPPTNRCRCRRIRAPQQAVEGFAREETLRHPGLVADAQLPRPQPQARTAGRAEAIRGAGRVPARRAQRRVDAGARGFRPRPVRQPAVRAVRRRRPARAVHHVDHRAAARPRRAGARGARRCDPLCPFGQKEIRGRGQDRARARRALSR